MKKGEVKIKWKKNCKQNCKFKTRKIKVMV